MANSAALSEQMKEWAAAHLIGRRELLYRKSGNPIHVWRAYATARTLHVAIPDWVLVYFDRCAQTLATGTHKSAKAIADALELGTRGGPGVTRKAATEERNLAMVERILALQERPTRAELEALADEHALEKPVVDPGDRGLLDILTQVAEEYGLRVDAVTGIYYKMIRASKRPAPRL
jgi:hypothetical protein